MENRTRQNSISCNYECKNAVFVEVPPEDNP